MSAEFAPANVEYLPTSHFMHAVDPLTSEYSDAPHLMQIEEPVSEEYLPLMHDEQFDDLIAPVRFKYEPFTHEVHSVAPCESANVPTLHGKHAS